MSIGTPWGSAHPHHLESVVWADVAGLSADRGPVTRAQAMSIPAVARARNLLCATTAGVPMNAKRGDQVVEGVGWLDRSDGIVSPFQRMLHTTDDLLFYGVSLWGAARGADGTVIRAAHVPINRWTIDADGWIKVDDARVRADEVILIPGIHEGILDYGASTVRRARNMLTAADKAVENPAAMLELHQEDGPPLTDVQITELVAGWVKARRGENGGVGYTSKGIKTIEHGSAQEHLLIGGRNADAIDIARLTGIPASLIDAVQSGSSVTYQNSQARMAELVTFGLAPTMAAIAARLGQDDVVPRGVHIEFDLNAALAALPTVVTGNDDRTDTTTPAATAQETTVQ